MHTKVRFLTTFWQRNIVGSGPYLTKYTKKPNITAATGDSIPGPMPTATATQYIFTRTLLTPVIKTATGCSMSKHEVRFDTDGTVNDFVIASTYPVAFIAPSRMN
jgi:hypothetical protein